MSTAVQIHDDYGKYLMSELLKTLAKLFNEIGPKALDQAKRLCQDCIRKFQRWVMVAEEWSLEQKLDMVNKYKLMVDGAIKKISDPPSFFQCLVSIVGVSGVALLYWFKDNVKRGVVFFVTGTGVVGGVIGSIIGTEVLTSVTVGLLGGAACLCIYYGAKAIKRRFFDYDEHERQEWFAMVNQWFNDAGKKLRDYYSTYGNDPNATQGTPSPQQPLSEDNKFDAEVVEEESRTRFNVQVPRVHGGVNVQYGNSTRKVTKSASSSNQKYQNVGEQSSTVVRAINC